jgi:aminoglycoside phosphotransferase (APT) family kinase protein
MNNIEGESLNLIKNLDYEEFFYSVGNFLKQIQSIKINSPYIPVPSIENFWRRHHPSIYSSETYKALDHLKNIIDMEKIRAVWENLIESSWTKPYVWLHGDLSPGNIVMKNNQICGFINFSACCMGDPACDYSIFHTFLPKIYREKTKSLLNVDKNTCNRSKAWALWKALITLVEGKQDSLEGQKQKNIINEIIYKFVLDDKYSIILYIVFLVGGT